MQDRKDRKKPNTTIHGYIKQSPPHRYHAAKTRQATYHYRKFYVHIQRETPAREPKSET